MTLHSSYPANQSAIELQMPLETTSKNIVCSDSATTNSDISTHGRRNLPFLATADSSKIEVRVSDILETFEMDLRVPSESSETYKQSQLDEKVIQNVATADQSEIEMRVSEDGSTNSMLPNEIPIVVTISPIDMKSLPYLAATNPSRIEVTNPSEIEVRVPSNGSFAIVDSRDTPKVLPTTSAGISKMNNESLIYLPIVNQSEIEIRIPTSSSEGDKQISQIDLKAFKIVVTPNQSEIEIQDSAVSYPRSASSSSEISVVENKHHTKLLPCVANLSGIEIRVSPDNSITCIAQTSSWISDNHVEEKESPHTGDQPARMVSRDICVASGEVDHLNKKPHSFVALTDAAENEVRVPARLSLANIAASLDFAQLTALPTMGDETRQTRRMYFIDDKSLLDRPATCEVNSDPSENDNMSEISMDISVSDILGDLEEESSQPESIKEPVWDPFNLGNTLIEPTSHGDLEEEVNQDEANQDEANQDKANQLVNDTKKVSKTSDNNELAILKRFEEAMDAMYHDHFLIASKDNTNDDKGQNTPTTSTTEQYKKDPTSFSFSMGKKTLSKTFLLDRNESSPENGKEHDRPTFDGLKNFFSHDKIHEEVDESTVDTEINSFESEQSIEEARPTPIIIIRSGEQFICATC